jgi:hypothetical protein
MEIWKKINIDNLNNYEVSTFGNIRNSNTKRILKIKNIENGYSIIFLNKKTYKIHRLVAYGFLDNLDNKPTVNHIDRNKHNNKLDNLEWATYSEQKNHSKNINNNNNRGIWKICIETGNKIKKYNTIKEAGNEINLNSNSYKNISACALGKTNTAYGFRWQYEENEPIENEIWKPFKNEKMKNQNYFVSNLGRIKNRNRILKKTIDNNGYYNVNDKLIHIIVANNFIENPNNYNIVNHKDGNKLNNNVNNLEWVTQQMNSIHAVNNQLRKNIKKVVQLNNNKIVKIFNSCMEASKELNVNCRSINKCCKGELKSCGKQKLNFLYLDEHNNNISNKSKINNTNIKNKKHKKVNVYNKNNILIDQCKTITDASKKYNLNNKTISAHCDNKVKYPNIDYIFKYCIE